jgi:hypothetical protein
MASSATVQVGLRGRLARPGWAGVGLPVVHLDQATALFEAMLTGWVRQ